MLYPEKNEYANLFKPNFYPPYALKIMTNKDIKKKKNKAFL